MQRIVEPGHRLLVRAGVSVACMHGERRFAAVAALASRLDKQCSELRRDVRAHAPGPSRAPGLGRALCTVGFRGRRALHRDRRVRAVGAAARAHVRPHGRRAALVRVVRARVGRRVDSRRRSRDGRSTLAALRPRIRQPSARRCTATAATASRGTATGYRPRSSNRWLRSFPSVRRASCGCDHSSVVATRARSHCCRVSSS